MPQRPAALTLGVPAEGEPAECYRARMWSLWTDPPALAEVDDMAGLPRAARLARLDELCAQTDRTQAPLVLALWHRDARGDSGTAANAWRQLIDSAATG